MPDPVQPCRSLNVGYFTAKSINKTVVFLRIRWPESSEYAHAELDQGKVEVFVRQKAGENPSIHQVNFFYVQNGGEWTFDGSDASASEESHQKGLRVFARRNPAALKQPEQPVPASTQSSQPAPPGL